jgi:hypothetical protein
MYKQRWHRDQIVQDLALELTSAVWSYASTGRVLQPEPDPLKEWVHHFDGTWYDSTAFSVVVESYMRSDSWVRSPVVPSYRTEVSEKLFKPCMFYHPIVVYGSLGTLEYLHREGFETFDNLWDESYDLIDVDQQRHDAVTSLILSNVQRFQAGDLGIDSLTQQKLEHNHARVFDRDLVLQRFEREIIGDLQRFLE